MSSLQPHVSDAVDALYEQAIEQVERGHNAFTVACTLTPENLHEFDDARAGWHHQYGLGSHFRAMVLRELWDYGWQDLHRTLSKHDRARTIGYDPEKIPEGKDAPHRTTLSRAWNNYLGDDVKQVVEDLCGHIRDFARETGNLLGSQTLSVEDKEDVSPRTEYRVKRRTAHEAADQFREVFYDKIDLGLPEGAAYTKEDLLDLFLHMAFSNDFANNGAKTWREEVDDESTAPSGETLRNYIRIFDELDDGKVSEMFDALSDILWKMADRRGYLDGFVDVAIDGHNWLYYGDSETPRISSVNPDRGTNKAYQFLTLSVVGDEGEKFTLAVRQVTSKQEKLEAVKAMVKIADERVFIRDAILDRGFAEVLFAQALLETGVNFVIRARRNSKTKSMWMESKDGVNVEHGVTMSRSRPPYESVTITRLVLPARERVDYEYITFITNRELTRRQARRIGKSYERRWGIETSYRVTQDFLPRTASTDFALRQFYYRLSVLLYNIWVLVNAVVEKSIDHPSDASPPVTAKYLLVVLRNKHGDQSVT
ncbi:transposase [Natronococcus sp. A-GB7]|uniref:transposase n=1 Tax=Natronococcus sp. A-GB7 TaxID=3037649 RepID=UPI00241E9333|nr:transposase [Natronococcus sp. A-GB7]MDG5821816.1 transposase [Natronococcus sp. A-GB7]